VAIHVFNPSLCVALGYKVFPHFADVVLYVEFECEAICDHHSLQVRTPSFAPSPTPTQSRADASKGKKINGWPIAVICLSQIVFCSFVAVSRFVIKSRRQRATDNILSTAFEIDETLDLSASVTSCNLQPSRIVVLG
jgi:hypothetical protein